MSILIPYTLDPSLIHVCRCLPTEQALALDGLDLLFSALSDISIRLEERLMALSHSQTSSTVMKQRLAVTDVWAFIDCVHRAGELFDKARVATNDAEKVLLEKIKAIRNSYHHANDRIHEHFAMKGGSIFGELSWFYHPDIHRFDEFSGAIHEFNLRSGITVIDEFTVITSDPKSRELDDIISCVEMHYIKKPKANQPYTEELIVNLDEAKELVNRAISRIGVMVQRIDEKFKAELILNPELRFRGFPPMVVVANSSYTRSLRRE